MTFSLLVTVAIASGSSVAATWALIHNLYVRLDSRIDEVMLAIAEKNGRINLLDDRVRRLESHERTEARQLKSVLTDLQGWVDQINQPFQTRTDP